MYDFRIVVFVLFTFNEINDIPNGCRQGSMMGELYYEPLKTKKDYILKSRFSLNYLL